MTPDQVREAIAGIEQAQHAGDDDAAGQIAIRILCGAALNLAIIAQRQITAPVWVGYDPGSPEKFSHAGTSPPA